MPFLLHAEQVSDFSQEVDGTKAWNLTTLMLFSCPLMSDFVTHGLQHTKPPCPSPPPRVCPSSCPLHWWCQPAISSSDALFSFCPQSFPASGTFPIVSYYQQQVMLKVMLKVSSIQFSSVTQSCPTLCDPMNHSLPGSLSITNSQSLLKLMLIESGMPSSHLILCRPLLLLPPIPPSISIFPNESTLHMRWPKY